MALVLEPHPEAGDLIRRYHRRILLLLGAAAGSPCGQSGCQRACADTRAFVVVAVVLVTAQSPVIFVPGLVPVLVLVLVLVPVLGIQPSLQTGAMLPLLAVLIRRMAVGISPLQALRW